MMIVILGVLFLLAALVALYVLIDKKIIANPFTYLFPGLNDLTSPTDSTSPTDLMDSLTTPSTYVDRLSPNKVVKGRYIKIAQIANNSNSDSSIYLDRKKPITLTRIFVNDKSGESLGLNSSNVVAYSSPGESLSNSDYLFDEEEADANGEMIYTKAETNFTTSTNNDYIMLDLKKELIISEIILEMQNNVNVISNVYNMVGVYVEIQDETNRPIAVTPIITTPAKICSFKFPGKEWDVDEVDNLTFYSMELPHFG